MGIARVSRPIAWLLATLAVGVALGWGARSLLRPSIASRRPQQLSEEPHALDPVVATVDGFPIRASTVLREMQRRGGRVPGRFDDLAKKRDLLDELLRSEVLAIAGERAGLSEDPELVATRRREVAERFWRDQLAQLSAEIKVSDDEIRAAFERDRQKLGTPARLRLAAIRLRAPANDPNARAATRDRAESIARRARSSASDPEAFAKLAAAESDDPPSRARGGDLGWIVEGTTYPGWDGAVVRAAQAVDEVGAVSSVVDTPQAFYIVRLVDRERGSEATFEAVEARLHNDIYAEKIRRAQEDRYAAILSEFSIQVDEAALGALKIERPKIGDDEGPPRFPLVKANE